MTVHELRFAYNGQDYSVYARREGLTYFVNEVRDDESHSAATMVWSVADFCGYMDKISADAYLPPDQSIFLFMSKVIFE